MMEEMKFLMNNLDESLLQDTFFQPETKCGYYVSGRIKKVWAVEIDLLKKFAEVCEKYELSYFMDGGTLLGAVRHKGFIPWDDDADVIMPRKDYNKLWSVAAEEFQEPYFFQTTLSENKFFRTHAQLRNSLTTGFIEEDREKDINRGIFIDIFVLDNIPDSVYKKELLRIKIGIEKKILTYQYNLNYPTLSIKGKFFYCFVHFFFRLFSFKKFFSRFNLKTLGKYMNEQTATVGDITLDWRTNVQWSGEWFNDYVYLPFENLMLRAPASYDKVLTKQYGDYLKIPEDVSAPNFRSHGNVTFEPETPYKEYFREQSVKKQGGTIYEYSNYHSRWHRKKDGTGDSQAVH